MVMIKELLTAELNGLNVKLFKYNMDDEDNINELKNYLLSKIRQSSLHNNEQYEFNYYCSKNMNDEFIQKLNDSIAKIAIPSKAILPQFDVRRERVTEWMAQLLLESVL